MGGNIRIGINPRAMQTEKTRKEIKAMSRIMWTEQDRQERAELDRSLAVAAEPVLEAKKSFYWSGENYVCDDPVNPEHWKIMYCYFLGYGDALSQFLPDTKRPCETYYR